MHRKYLMCAWHAVRTQLQVGKTNVCLRFLLIAYVSSPLLNEMARIPSIFAVHKASNSPWHRTLAYMVTDINIYGRSHSGQNFII